VIYLFLVATVNAPRVESPSSFVWGAITWSAGASRETKINSYRLHWASLHAEGPLVRSENLLLMIFWPPSTWNRRLHPSCSDNILAWFCLSICLMNDLQTQSKLNGRYCCPSVGSPVWTEPTKKEIQTWIFCMVHQASLKYMKQSFVFWTILINSFWSKNQSSLLSKSFTWSYSITYNVWYFTDPLLKYRVVVEIFPQ
jgi:hypothetical protein